MPSSRTIGVTGLGGAPHWTPLGVDPDIYLWEGSPCAFPGVRRYAGSTEFAVFRKRATPDSAPPHCLALDDNDYPKHLWAFIFTDKPFRKKGPSDYQLAHLLDHKRAGNRWRDELVCPSEPPLPYGLFTSAANAILRAGCLPAPHGLLHQAAEPPPETGAAVVRRRLLLGAATIRGEALRGFGLGSRQLSVECARGQQGTRS